jgi:galactokinase
MPTADAHPDDDLAREQLHRLAATAGLDVRGGRLLRTSSRFCLGVEHGDYNGTELFGVGTDRFLWSLSRPNGLGRVRLFSGAFPAEGRVEFVPGQVPPAQAPELAGRWARFPCGVDQVLRRAGHPLRQGIDIVLHSTIPGGGMSRSASLCLNLLLVFAAANGHRLDDRLRLCELAQAVENDYVGSPCGLLDQVMIAFARAGAGTHYRPADQSVAHVAIGERAPDFRFMALDTGTVRPGLEQSTYAVRRRECAQLLAMLTPGFGLRTLADVRDAALHERIQRRLRPAHAHLGDRLRYLFEAQQRFVRMLAAWRAGDIAEVGALFRADGEGLRDLYAISGRELEAMCRIARSVPGVFGERMLGGGDRGASGALVAAQAVPALCAAVAAEYPRLHPEQAQTYAVHECRVVDGIVELPSG